MHRHDNTTTSTSFDMITTFYSNVSTNAKITERVTCNEYGEEGGGGGGKGAVCVRPIQPVEGGS